MPEVRGGLPAGEDAGGGIEHEDRLVRRGDLTPEASGQVLIEGVGGGAARSQRGDEILGGEDVSVGEQVLLPCLGGRQAAIVFLEVAEGGSGDTRQLLARRVLAAALQEDPLDARAPGVLEKGPLQVDLPLGASAHEVDAVVECEGCGCHEVEPRLIPHGRRGRHEPPLQRRGGEGHEERQGLDDPHHVNLGGDVAHRVSELPGGLGIASPRNTAPRQGSVIVAPGDVGRVQIEDNCRIGSVLSQAHPRHDQGCQ